MNEAMKDILVKALAERIKADNGAMTILQVPVPLQEAVQAVVNGDGK
jgi:hypothetical protein